MAASAAARLVVTQSLLWAAGVVLVAGTSSPGDTLLVGGTLRPGDTLLVGGTLSSGDTLLVGGTLSRGAAETPAPLTVSASRSSRQGTGTLQGAVSTPWAVDDANSVVAVYVAGAAYEPAQPDPLIDQFDLTFVPHVLPVTVGTRVRFLNSDTVLHNVFSPSDAVTAFDLGTYSADGERSVDFEVPGEVVVLCNVHPQMSAFVLVLETAFWAVTDEAGDYSLGGIPAGTHRVRVWSQAAEPLEAEVTIVPGAETRTDFAFSKRRRGGWIKRRAGASITTVAAAHVPEDRPADDRYRSR